MVARKSPPDFLSFHPVGIAIRALKSATEAFLAQVRVSTKIFERCVETQTEKYPHLGADKVAAENTWATSASCDEEEEE